MKSALPWLLALAVLVVGLLYGREMQARGAAEATSASLRIALADLAKRTAKVDTVFVTQSRTLTRWRDSVVTLRESLTVTDTVEVLRFIAVQDSTITSCTALVLTCEQRVALRDSTIRTLNRQWKERPKPPNPVWRWAERLGWIGLVVLVAK